MASSLRRTPRRFAATVVACALATAASGCATSGPGSANTGYITGNGVVTTIAPADRTDVPEVRGQALGGGRVDISAHGGKVVVINVWASWCPPCRAEAPELVAAARRLPRASFVGIDTREDSSAAAEAFVREHAIPYDSIYDEDGSVMLSFYGMLSPSSLPSTMVVDRQGRIAALVLGPLTADTLVGLVRDVAAQS